jgi:hypothetical protein
MRSKLSAITARTPSSSVPLAAQSRDDPVPYSLPAITISGTTSVPVALGRVEDRQALARREVRGDAALDAGDQKVLQPDVGEGAAHHHPVVAAARAVRVEVRLGDAERLEVLARGALSGDVARRRDVVGGHRVAEQASTRAPATGGGRRASA